jgi:hypothetical protein
MAEARTRWQALVKMRPGLLLVSSPCRVNPYPPHNIREPTGGSSECKLMATKANRLDCATTASATWPARA